MLKTIQFRDDLSFCSNFYKCDVEVDGIIYPSSEHAFMAEKTCDIEIKKQIALMAKPGDAKRFGRTLKLREDWDRDKSLAMLKVLIAKFSQNKDLLSKLKNISDEDLVETNTWKDKYWGVCDGEGRNILGRLLQVVKHAL